MEKIKIHVVSRKDVLTKLTVDVQQLLDSRIHPNDIPQSLCVSGCTIWTFQTLVALNFYYPERVECTFSSTCRADCINLLHHDDFSARVKPWRGLTVVCRADRPAVIGADYVVEQIKSAEKQGGIFISHWPQPGLKPRHSLRNSVTTLGYFGRMDSFPHELASESFKGKLKAHGFSLKIELNNWTDYQDVDVVLCFRKQHDYTLSRKPASKLINAWLAGCVLVCDDEPAIKAVRESDLDYLVAHTPDDIINAATMLKNRPDLYQQMIVHGRERLKVYSREAVAKDWIDLFEKIWNKGLDKRNPMTRMISFAFGKLTQPLRK